MRASILLFVLFIFSIYSCKPTDSSVSDVIDVEWNSVTLKGNTVTYINSDSMGNLYIHVYDYELGTRTFSADRGTFLFQEIKEPFVSGEILIEPEKNWLVQKKNNRITARKLGVHDSIKIDIPGPAPAYSMLVSGDNVYLTTNVDNDYNYLLRYNLISLKIDTLYKDLNRFLRVESKFNENLYFTRFLEMVRTNSEDLNLFPEFIFNSSETLTDQITKFISTEDNNTLFISTRRDRILRSVDNGENWDRVWPDDVPIIDALDIIHSSSGALFAAIFDQGIFFSLDNGDTWKSLEKDGLDLEIYSLSVLDKTLLVGTGSGLFQSSQLEILK